MTTKHTPGPWFADDLGRIWRRPPSELYENGGGVAGDKPIAVVSVGWVGEGVTGYPVEDNARLIAAAPDLLRYLKEARRTLEMWKDVAPAVSLCADIDAAIARATGESE